MTESAPDARRTTGRRSLLAAAAWSVPVVAAAVAAPVVAATTTPQDAGDLLVTITHVKSQTRPGYDTLFSLTPSSAAVPIPQGTLVTIEVTGVHSRLWTVVSSQFDYVSTVVDPPGDSVNANHTASTYLTRLPFASTHSIGLYSVQWRDSRLWGLRVTATLPAGWSAGPNAVLAATQGPLYP
ncbi:hypothetical protein [Microbacterium sp. No. 7]|uniref:hypothetical protein n=1 Tax=Microbacterium sp. No. 7 TaxID=1714373 RepID=UPI0006D1EB0D|nr:hypothetical protein [Microbacterium sp. No. 7]ALJ18785.1 hypothetical protein AOA12_02190 [Microbacterium sp. No. 7]